MCARYGYADDDIGEILGENLLRVWSEAEAFAAAAQDDVTQTS